MYEENRPGVGAPERPALRRVPWILHESSTWYHLRSAVSNTGAIFVPIFQEVCMKVTKLPSGNYRCRFYVGTDDTGKRLWKSFTGPNRKRVEQDADNHAEVRALHQQHPAADLHTYPSGSISEGNGTDPEWLQRDRGMTSVLVDFVSHTHQKSGFLWHETGFLPFIFETGNYQKSPHFQRF